MEWQLRAERSLFYNKHCGYETKATGILLIRHDNSFHDAAERIIRNTMWQRKQLIKNKSNFERNKPVQYSRSPIRAAWYYEHVYLTCPILLEYEIYEIGS